MAGTRNTQQKQLILSLLREAGRPLTAGEVYERARRRRPAIAKSTVYRNLDAMLARGELTHGLLQNGEGFYAVTQEHGHLHYLICKGCSRMLDFPQCPLSQLEREIARSSGFEMTEHTLQIYGYCRDCRERKK